ncbi:MAG: hypothetical protein HDS07_00745 [Bacteroides sp.]|nr:hypothetical protein [Bacteroides sp.]
MQTSKMKHLLYLATLLIGASALMTSCSDDDTWSEYATWRNTNNEWYLARKDSLTAAGKPYYTALSPSWYVNSGVLIHYFNDRSLTEGNLSPMLTSQVTVKYKGQLYNGLTFDSTAVAGTDSVRTFGLQGVIDGWKVALTDMRVGDTCEIIVPYALAYGVNGSSGIAPYSTLRFGIKLVDIPAYEIR